MTACPPLSLGALVRQLSTRWKAEVERVVAPLGLTHGQYVVLAALLEFRRRGRVPCQREVAQAVGLTPIFVSKLVRGLAAAELVARLPDQADSRALRIGLSPAGLAAAEAARAEVRVAERRLAAPLGTPGGAKARALAAVLRAMMQAVPKPGERR